MVEVEGETSNTLLEELANWNTVLKQAKIDFEEVSDD